MVYTSAAVWVDELTATRSGYHCEGDQTVVRRHTKFFNQSLIQSMKKLIFLSFFLPILAKAQFVLVNNSTTSLIEPRTGTWPLDLQRVIRESDTSYVLAFRDQQENSSVNMSTLNFGNLDQVRYFGKGLAALRSGSTGEIAK